MTDRKKKYVIGKCTVCEMEYSLKRIGEGEEDDVYALDVANLRGPCCSDNLKISEK